MEPDWRAHAASFPADRAEEAKSELYVVTDALAAAKDHQAGRMHILGAVLPGVNAVPAWHDKDGGNGK
jgi:hypothetical protein